MIICPKGRAEAKMRQFRIVVHLPARYCFFFFNSINEKTGQKKTTAMRSMRSMARWRGGAFGQPVCFSKMKRGEPNKKTRPPRAQKGKRHDARTEIDPSVIHQSINRSTAVALLSCSSAVGYSTGQHPAAFSTRSSGFLICTHLHRARH